MPSPLGSARKLQGRKCVGAEGAGGVTVDVPELRLGPLERVLQDRSKERGQLGAYSSDGQGDEHGG